MDGETQYARTPEGVSIAYRVVGEGPPDILLLMAYAIDVLDDDRVFASVKRRLAAMGRVICFDWRGTGSSDPVPEDGLPSPEQWMDDARVVLDAVGSSRAVVVGSVMTGLVGVLFAASHPDRAEALVLVDTWAYAADVPDHPPGLPSEALDEFAAHVGDTWGDGSVLGIEAPSRASDEHARAWYGRMQRLTIPRGRAGDFFRWNFNVDARPALSSVQAPTLVIDHETSGLMSTAQGRYLVDQIAGARHTVLPGRAETWLLSERCAPDVLDEMEAFLTGARPARDIDRVLATVLFTDIVDSTVRAQAEGDARWRRLLDEHDALVGRAVQQFRGRLVKTTGDGVLATFDGPARAVRCAQAVAEGVRGLGLDVRAGVHTGEVELRGDDIGGIAVHIGARIAALAGAGEVLTSGTVRDLVTGSGLVFADRGVHELKGVAEPRALYLAEP